MVQTVFKDIKVNWNKFQEFAYISTVFIYLPNPGISLIHKTIFCCKFPGKIVFPDFLFHQCVKRIHGTHPKCTKLLLPILNRRKKIWKQSFGISHMKVIYTELQVIVITEIQNF
jgi:hypothetical protein